MRHAEQILAPATHPDGVILNGLQAVKNLARIGTIPSRASFAAESGYRALHRINIARITR